MIPDGLYHEEGKDPPFQEGQIQGLVSLAKAQVALFLNKENFPTTRVVRIAGMPGLNKVGDDISHLLRKEGGLLDPVSSVDFHTPRAERNVFSAVDKSFGKK